MRPKAQNPLSGSVEECIYCKCPNYGPRDVGLRIPDTYESKMDVLVCNFVNKPFFSKSDKKPLQVKMSRSCRFLLFLPHKYQVPLNLRFLFSRILPSDLVATQDQLGRIWPHQILYSSYDNVEMREGHQLLID